MEATTTSRLMEAKGAQKIKKIPRLPGVWSLSSLESHQVCPFVHVLHLEDGEIAAELEELGVEVETFFSSSWSAPLTKNPVPPSWPIVAECTLARPSACTSASRHGTPLGEDERSPVPRRSGDARGLFLPSSVLLFLSQPSS